MSATRIPDDPRSAIETTELEVYGDMAHEVGRYTVEAADASEADAGMYIVLWKREGSVWRMHRDIWNTRDQRS
jgi:hypothetical protein